MALHFITSPLDISFDLFRWLQRWECNSIGLSGSSFFTDSFLKNLRIYKVNSAGKLFLQSMMYFLLGTAALILFFVLRPVKKPTVKGISLSDDEINNTLSENVRFYKNLSVSDQAAFRERVKTFLNEVFIEGVKVKVSNLDKLLVASSAVIPVFNFPDWHYSNLTSVLLYPDRFNSNLGYASKEKNRMITGLVGSGKFDKKMIISIKALRLGFNNKTDKSNTAIHEFVHLIDGLDGSFDGVPERLIEHEYSIPWIKLIEKGMADIHAEKSDIRPYGGVSESEFFAVASEYFFERPNLMKRKHPELWEAFNSFFGERED